MFVVTKKDHTPLNNAHFLMFSLCMLLTLHSMEYSMKLFFYLYRLIGKCLTREEIKRNKTWSNLNGWNLENWIFHYRGMHTQMYCLCMLLKLNSMEFSTELLFYTYRSNKKCLTRDQPRGKIVVAILVANICKIEFHYYRGLMPLKFSVFACYLDLTVWNIQYRVIIILYI